MKAAIYEKAGKMTVAEIENQAFKPKMTSLSRSFGPVSVGRTFGATEKTFTMTTVTQTLVMKPSVSLKR